MEDTEGPLEIESAGAKMGVNPFFGEWRKCFYFSPVPHTARADKRAAFRERMRNDIDCRYYFTDEVKVEISLHIDEQRIRETDRTADLDNFAKCILDCIKGKDGILIDDCQIQSLHISWIDVYNETEWFEVEIRGHPDEFSLKEVALYEMPDGLWYPLSNHTWDKGKATPIDEVTKIAGPLILEAMTEFSKKIRAKLRDSGYNRMQAYRQSKYHATAARGFHKSRVEGEFELIKLKEWKRQVSELSERGDEKATEVIEMVRSFKDKKIESLKTWEQAYRSAN